MEKIIYLPQSTIRQLESSDDSSIWANPIQYREKPTPFFCLSLKYDPEDFEGIEPAVMGFFYPDRTEPDMVLERLVKVDPARYMAEEDLAPDLDDEDQSIDVYDYDIEVSDDIPASRTRNNYEPVPDEPSEVPMVDKASLEGMIAKCKKRFKVSGLTLLYTYRPNYEVFFDQEGEYIDSIHENDADFRDEYHGPLFAHFGINTQVFRLPKQLDELAEEVENYEKTLEGQDEHTDPDIAVIELIIQPFLIHTIKKD